MRNETHRYGAKLTGDLNGYLLTSFEVSIQRPNLTPHLVNRLAARLVQGNELMDKPFSMDPTQPMPQHVKLPGIVAHDRQVRRDAMVQHTAQQGTLGGNPTMMLLREPHLSQLGVPLGFSRKAALRMVPQARHQPLG